MAHLKQLSSLSLQIGRNEPTRKLPDMTFIADHLIGIVLPHSDPLVLSVHIDGQGINQFLIDEGAGANILYKSCFKRMEIDRSLATPTPSPIMGFSYEKIQPVGKIHLLVRISNDYGISRIVVQEFHICDSLCPCNYILGRCFVDTIVAVPSTFHQTMLLWQCTKKS